MKTSYEQFKEDVEKHNNEILVMLWAVGLCLIPVIQILTGIFVAGWIVHWLYQRFALIGAKRMYNKELERKRKMGYDV